MQVTSYPISATGKKPKPRFAKKAAHRVKGKRTPTPSYRKGLSKRDFYRTREWRELYHRTMREQKHCFMCSANDSLQAMHVKQRWTHPHLELTASNVKVLCKRCRLIVLVTNGEYGAPRHQLEASV